MIFQPKHDASQGNGYYQMHQDLDGNPLPGMTMLQGHPLLEGWPSRIPEDFLLRTRYAGEAKALTNSCYESEALSHQKSILPLAMQQV
jgi:hypothetical protein